MSSRFLSQFSFTVLLTLSAALASRLALADGSEVAEAFVPRHKQTVSISHTDAPVKIDGRLDDAVWQTAERTSHFTQIDPVEDVAPPVKTEVMVAYDSDNFYAAFICYGDPSEVRATMGDRDDIWADDGVSVLIDTYGAGSWLYELYVNPLGIQGDTRWTQSFGFDQSFDVVFESEALFTDSGYHIEMAVPFSSLRFPNTEEQNWRINFWRNFPRESNYSFYWSAIPRGNSCYPCQFGYLSGLKDIQPSTPIELLPSFVGFQSSQLNSMEDPASGLNSGNPDGEVSLGARYSFTPSVSAEGTINPDFSQVESDAGRIDVNSTFALYFPEKRPFFQEGGDLYNTWIRTVYTRSINDPSFAAKLTGRMSKSSVGWISAIDETTPLIMPFEERSRFVSLDRSVTNIGRAQYNYNQSSSVGVLLTDRRIVDGGSGSTASVDGTFAFLDKWRMDWQGVYSHTEEPDDTSLTSDYNGLFFDDGAHTVDFDGETFDGYAAKLGLARYSRNFNTVVNATAWSPTFRADNGFVTRNSSTEVNWESNWNLRSDKQIVQLFNPGFTVGRIWNWSGVRKDEWVLAKVFARLKGQYTVYAGQLWSRERYRGIEFNNIHQFEFNLTGEGSDVFRWGAGFGVQRNFIARNLNTPTEGNGMELSLSAAIYPVRRLFIRPQFQYGYLDRSDNGEPIFRAAVSRVRFHYQFTRELFLRLIVQYVKEDTYDETDPTQVDQYQSLSLEPLLTYRVNPFTLFYIGSTHQYEEGDFNDLWRQQTSYRQTSRQFFMKLQYLLNI